MLQYRYLFEITASPVDPDSHTHDRVFITLNVDRLSRVEALFAALAQLREHYPNKGLLKGRGAVKVLRCELMD